MMAATVEGDGHPNVIPYYGNAHFCDPTENYFSRWMVMEYLEYGNLEDLIVAAAEATGTNQTYALTKDVSRALVRCHSFSPPECQLPFTHSTPEVIQCPQGPFVPAWEAHCTRGFQSSMRTSLHLRRQLLTAS